MRRADAVGMGDVAGSVPVGATVARVVVAALVVVVLAVAAHVGRRRRMRRVLTEALSRRAPQRRAEAEDFARRAISLWRRSPGTYGFPADPFALRVPVVVAPLGDGRPGESFRAPREPVPGTDAVVEDGSRIDAQLPLAKGARFAVVCFGRVGAVRSGRVLRPAPDRVGMRRAALPAGTWAVGTVTRVDSPAGPGWRHTIASAHSTVTDTHVDHGGFAYVVGVSAPHDRPELARVADAVLATWRWLDDPAVGSRSSTPAPASASAAVAGSGPGTAPGEVVVRVGGDGRPAATFLAPAADALPAHARPGPGETPEALVPLGPTAELAVVSAPLAAPAGTRAVERARASLGVTGDPSGPARRVATPAGDGWRARYELGGGFVSHEVELDHGDRAWTVVLALGPDDAAAAGVLDRVLETWRWEA